MASIFVRSKLLQLLCSSLFLLCVVPVPSKADSDLEETLKAADTAAETYASGLDQRLFSSQILIEQNEKMATDAKRVAEASVMFYEESVRDHCPRGLKCLRGVPEEKLPEILRDSILARGKAEDAQKVLLTFQQDHRQVLAENVLSPGHVPSKAIAVESSALYVDPTASPPPSTASYTAVPVFFATNRELSNGTYSGKRGVLQWGLAWLTVPLDHRMGNLGAMPFFNFATKYFPSKYIILKSTKTLAQAEFQTGVSQVQKGMHSDSALLFVHGYNTPFEDAVRRAAQVAVDLQFRGPIICFTWPSLGEESQYVADRNNADVSTVVAGTFLESLLTQPGIQHVHILAHSMGTLIMSTALGDVFSTDKDGMKKISNVILAAPDIDSDYFKARLYPRLPIGKTTFTLYASSKDKALELANRLGGSYPRLGQAGQKIAVLPDITTIDATSVDTSFIGHSYFGDSRTVLSDIYHLITNGLPPEQRNLQRSSGQNGRYWKIPN